MSGAPIMSGTSQLPKPPIIAGITMKKIMMSPCPETNNVVHVAVGEILQSGFLQLEPHGDGERTADEPAEIRGREVHRPDVFVVRREETSVRHRKASDRARDPCLPRDPSFVLR